MRPEAHIQATIELMGLYEENATTPSDALLQRYFKTRRYIGGKDKKHIAGHYYSIVRHWGIYEWVLKRRTNVNRARAAVLLYLMREGRFLEEIEDLFSGEMFSPAPLTFEERQVVRQGAETLFEFAPKSLQQGVTPWIHEKLVAQYGEQVDALLDAMDSQASFDFRVNPLKLTRSEGALKFMEQGLHIDTTPFSPHGLRLSGRMGRDDLEQFGPGLFEVQDEASQLVALLVDAKPGQRVLDLCAGAGGKTLLMAATMNNAGNIVACDIYQGRLDKAAIRLRRAGVHNVTRRLVEGVKDRWLTRQSVPCSGSGTWRRNPDMKWKLTPQGLEELLVVQQDLLQRAAQTVKVGGRLVYATCSLFQEENQLQIEKFLAQNPDFERVSVSDLWERVIQTSQPTGCEEFFCVTPDVHQMDGFFAAILERKGGK
jgi:16S rRNA (cytosine967-C5)-methyltransferase